MLPKPNPEQKFTTWDEKIETLSESKFHEQVVAANQDDEERMRILRQY